ncbi:unnamed protein product [Allacma fusca]|uniref:maleylacetoacetate isomerase n=1 Tax=Allacma fusca TaxID=39272 RepID=A0A8J2PE51_9HEXA|nr:unnamed protein product [Allacma fusca]
MSRPILYAFHVSSCSWRVRIALAHKKIEHDIRVVNIVNRESRSPEYMSKVNPAGQIPALEVNGNVIAESLAILEYLEEVYPQKPLLPKEAIERAKVREICELIATGIQPLQNPKVAARHSTETEKRLEWTEYYINRGFIALEKILNTTSANGKYCYGDSLTTADCVLVPQVFNAIARFKLDMTPYPKIMSIYNSLMKLEEVKLGHPDNKLS